MPDTRTPKRVLFDWLPQTRPAHGPRRRWRDVIRRDLRFLDLSGEHWYEAAQSRRSWRVTCSDGLEVAQQQQQQHQRAPSPERQVGCTQCRRVFRREADKRRHKCLQERQKPVSEQLGAVQCTICHRWFRSRGGLTVHRCQAPQPQ